jgi:tetratricopeptide (TPR) repeat protein
MCVMDRESRWRERAVAVVDRVNTVFPNPEFENWNLCEELVLSAASLSKQIIELAIETQNAALLLNQVASYLFEKGQYTDVEDFYIFSLDIKTKQPINNNNLRDIADISDGLANYCHAIGSYVQAEYLYQKSLKIRESIFGKNNFQIAKSLNNMAGIYHAQRKNHRQVESFYKQALSIMGDTLEKNHYATANVLNNLAFFYQSQRKFKKSQVLYLRVLEILEKILPEEHPDILQILNNLGGMYEQSGKYEQAIIFHQRCLAIREKCLGKYHPDVATSITNLALVYYKTSKYEQAESFCKQGLMIRENASKRNNIDVANSRSTLIEIYRKLGKYDDAARIYKNDLAVLQKHYGKYHKFSLVRKIDLKILTFEQRIFNLINWLKSKF